MGDGIAIDEIIRFFEAKSAEHNLMVFADVDSRRYTRKLALKFGVDFETFVSLSTVDRGVGLRDGEWKSG